MHHLPYCQFGLDNNSPQFQYFINLTFDSEFGKRAAVSNGLLMMSLYWSFSLKERSIWDWEKLRSDGSFTQPFNQLSEPQLSSSYVQITKSPSTPSRPSINPFFPSDNGTRKAEKELHRTLLRAAYHYDQRRQRGRGGNWKYFPCHKGNKQVVL